MCFWYHFVEMKGKRSLHSAIEVLSWFSFFALSIGLGLFVKDIWHDYRAGKTNDRVYSESVDYFRHPTISICFEPQLNETTLMEKYNKTITDLNIDSQSMGILDLNVPVSTLLDEVNFKLGRDFTLFLMFSGHESNNDYIFAYINTMKDAEEMQILKVEYLSTLSYGTCTVIKVSDKVKGSIQLMNGLKLTFKSKDVNKLPLVNVFFTSEENFHGAAWRQWIEGDVYALTIDPKQNLDSTVNLKQQIRRRLKDSSNCHQDGGFYNCMAKR